ncbi:ABC-type multidrug transport system, ATPase and permease component [Pilibacter termitis]|uniref:ABC-type multidrug transport system, ATPase and permease component n=1 Tax=Pilibacter termitis TaxID=263852 RepID=A0A1T4L1W0_9ENTE|nr:ABC transporter ATP-binding protein [Pilibacter termitis]SJZ48704.1 ABC-type multidrug transport system, ATPase and permease component [Pilibacter termitis]
MKEVAVLFWLLSFVRSLKLKMLLAVIFGVISNLSVVAISVSGAWYLFEIFHGTREFQFSDIFLLIGLGVLRGVARYCEQYLNHDIAFSLLAIIRSNIFRTLRKLGVARIAGKNSGDLITMITNDVEALEVFFAHTISPVLIASATVVITFIFLVKMSVTIALIVAFGQLIVGVLIPWRSYLQYKKIGEGYQENFAKVNQLIVEMMRSLRDIRQMRLQEKKINQLKQSSEKMNEQYKIKLAQQSQIQILSDGVFLLTTLFVLLANHFSQNSVQTTILTTIMSLSSFGPLFALSGLGNALLGTLASAKRLYQLSQEKPTVVFLEKETNEKIKLQNLQLHSLNFSFGETKTLQNLNLEVKKGEIIGIGGESGSGKSTLVKLLMRYWDVENGEILLNGQSITQLSERELHQLESVMAQSSFLFKGTIAENISLGLEASDEEIENAAKMAAIHQWIEELPEKYETRIGAGTREISEGERQRIGLARLFLHGGDFVLLDEPTSNLDYLNEQMILKTIKKLAQNKTVLLISHRETTLSICDRRYHLSEGRLRG